MAAVGFAIAMIVDGQNGRRPHIRHLEAGLKSVDEIGVAFGIGTEHAL